MSKTWAIVIKTPDGYMVYDPITDDYVCDVKGDNLFDSYMDAEKLLNTYNEEAAWVVTHEELHAKQLAISQKHQQHFDVAMDYIINEKLTTVRSEKE